MSFFETIAAELDREGIESRVNEDTLFVPITNDLEVQFVTLSEELPAAEVYVAAADSDDIDDEFEAVLVSVVFSADDAVQAVQHHIATDQVVSLLRLLLEGDDRRLEELQFEQDPEEATLLTAEIGECSYIEVFVTAKGNQPQATVRFVTQDINLDELVDQVIEEFWDSDTETVLTDDDRRRMFAELYADAQSLRNEMMTLGTFTETEKLLDVLAFAVTHAEDWEEQLSPVDDGSAEGLYSWYLEDLDDELDDDELDD